MTVEQKQCTGTVFVFFLFFFSCVFIEKLKQKNKIIKTENLIFYEPKKLHQFLKCTPSEPVLFLKFELLALSYTRSLFIKRLFMTHEHITKKNTVH